MGKGHAVAFETAGNLQCRDIERACGGGDDKDPNAVMVVVAEAAGVEVYRMMGLGISTLSMMAGCKPAVFGILVRIRESIDFSRKITKYKIVLCQVSVSEKQSLFLQCALPGSTCTPQCMYGNIPQASLLYAPDPRKPGAPRDLWDTHYTTPSYS